MQIADDFIENVVTASCEIAKHRHSETLEVKDVQLYLDKAWNMWVPGFGSEELRPYRKAPATEAHKQASNKLSLLIKWSHPQPLCCIWQVDLGGSQLHSRFTQNMLVIIPMEIDNIVLSFLEDGIDKENIKEILNVKQLKHLRTL